MNDHCGNEGYGGTNGIGGRGGPGFTVRVTLTSVGGRYLVRVRNVDC